MTAFGLDVFLQDLPASLKGCRIGVVCHAASITSKFEHIIDMLARRDDITLAAIFGPQHGLFGQTQDNMIEWEGGGAPHPIYKIPIYSLYGATRKPHPVTLKGLDALVIDLQDVGARPYTYIWTLKLCMEACSEAGIALWVLDRPNPIAALSCDGPMLSTDFFTFVGGANIPLCHRMTMAEMARLIHQQYFPQTNLNVMPMAHWWRNSLWHETGLPWVLPSPNMPSLDSAIVYPGMVLFEATNVSEGRGTVRPFELFGAPFINPRSFLSALDPAMHPGALLREHSFMPTFNKFHTELCNGFQIHVSQPRIYKPVLTAIAILAAIIKTAGSEFFFKDPPYEYEMLKMPFDILAGDSELRCCLQSGEPLADLTGRWLTAHREFQRVLESVSLYSESRA